MAQEAAERILQAVSGEGKCVVVYHHSMTGAVEAAQSTAIRAGTEHMVVLFEQGSLTRAAELLVGVGSAGDEDMVALVQRCLSIRLGHAVWCNSSIRSLILKLSPEGTAAQPSEAATTIAPQPAEAVSTAASTASGKRECSSGVQQSVSTKKSRCSDDSVDVEGSLKTFSLTGGPHGLGLTLSLVKPGEIVVKGYGTSNKSIAQEAGIIPGDVLMYCDDVRCLEFGDTIEMLQDKVDKGATTRLKIWRAE